MLNPWLEFSAIGTDKGRTMKIPERMAKKKALTSQNIASLKIEVHADLNKMAQSRVDGVRPLPAGYKMIPVRTTYLEMRSPTIPDAPAPPPGCSVERWEKPGSIEYRELFAGVGGAWGWSGRLILGEEELKIVLHAQTTEIFRLRYRGQTAGFAEFDRRVEGQVEITYFGLLAEFIGRGLGRFFLGWTVRRAWDGGTERVWLHTCEFDHPKALATYVKAGFSVCGEAKESQPYSEEFLRRRLK